MPVLNNKPLLFTFSSGNIERKVSELGWRIELDGDGRTKARELHGSKDARSKDSRTTIISIACDFLVNV
jgi:hypothetical protein